MSLIPEYCCWLVWILSRTIFCPFLLYIHTRREPYSACSTSYLHSEQCRY